MEESFLAFWVFFIIIPLCLESPIFNRMLVFILPSAVFVIYKIDFFDKFWYIPISIIILYYPLILNRAMKVRISGRENHQSKAQYFKTSIKLIIFLMIIIMFLMFLTFRNIIGVYNGILLEKTSLLYIILTSTTIIMILSMSIDNILFYMISPIITIDKREIISQIDRVWYEVCTGRSRRTCYYAIFKEDNCVFSISSFYYKKFLREKGSIYKYIIKKGLFGHVFMSEIPEMVEEISLQEKENNLIEYNSMKKNTRERAMIALVFILVIYVLFMFIYKKLRS
ncbi:hypothetical protein [Fusobacterium sp. PH5-44]|uniref:hypothetical protein n=1 Tax=unclassified Fusobacterium TaxID=2648384 RepID=UPI003D19362A